jgi:hypothetical protein
MNNSATAGAADGDVCLTEPAARVITSGVMVLIAAQATFTPPLS